MDVKELQKDAGRRMDGAIENRTNTQILKPNPSFFLFSHIPKSPELSHMLPD